MPTAGSHQTEGNHIASELASLRWPLRVLPPTDITAWGRTIAAPPYHPNAAGMAAVAQPVLTTLAEDR